MSTHDADKIRKPKDTIRLIFHKRNDSLIQSFCLQDQRMTRSLTDSDSCLNS